MAHGVLHRAQQRVRACPRPAPACSCASPVLRDSTAQGCRGHHMGSSPRLLQLLTGTQRLARAALRGSAMCTAAVPLWMRLLPNEAGWPVPLCRRPSSSGLCVRQQTGRLLVSPAAGIRAVPPSFRTDPASAATSLAHPAAHPAAHTVQPATRSRAHRAASTQPSAVGQPCTQPSAQHRPL